MGESTSLDYSEIPLSALRMKTRNSLSMYLNSCKVLQSPSKCFRDWRGLAEIGSVSWPPCSCPDPTEYVLCHLIKATDSPTGYTLGDLVNCLEDMDRFDVLDDLSESFNDDARLYLRGGRNERGLLLDEARNNLDVDRYILTLDDVQRLEEGLAPQNYDAFLLYSEEDSAFARQMLERLENDYNLKLCIKDRDLVGGVTFEHDAIMRLISERCNRLVIIVSPSFLESPANKFFVSYAQALGIEQRQRKIVPCVYQKFVLPRDLSYYFVLDYTRTSSLWNFWDRLSKSITAPVVNARLAIGPASILTTREEPSVEWATEKSSLSVVDIDNNVTAGRDHSPVVTLADEDNSAPPPAYSQAVRKTTSGRTYSSLLRWLPSPPSTNPSPPSSGKVKSKRTAWFRKKKKIQVSS